MGEVPLHTLLKTEDGFQSRNPSFPGTDVQKYLAYKESRPPQEFLRALGIGLLQGPRGGGVLISEVPHVGRSFSLSSYRHQGHKMDSDNVHVLQGNFCPTESSLLTIYWSESTLPWR